MQKLKINEDIRSLSEVRNGMANFIKQVHDTKRPVIITQHGKGIAVLLGANEFEAMQEKIELLSDIQTSLNQLEKGAGISHKDAKEKLLKLSSKMRIIWSPLAVDRASEVADYIAQDKPSAAEKWIDTVFSKVEQLKSSPEIGRIVPEINDSQFRELIYGDYRIIYRIETKQISILTIRHGRQILPINEIKA
jgi:prevent-host-death family protein